MRWRTGKKRCAREGTIRLKCPIVLTFGSGRGAVSGPSDVFHGLEPNYLEHFQVTLWSQRSRHAVSPGIAAYCRCFGLRVADHICEL